MIKIPTTRSILLNFSSMAPSMRDGAHTTLTTPSRM